MRGKKKKTTHTHIDAINKECCVPKEAVLKGSDLLNTDTDKVQAVDVTCLTHLKKKKSRFRSKKARRKKQA